MGAAGPVAQVEPRLSMSPDTEVCELTAVFLWVSVVSKILKHVAESIS